MKGESYTESGQERTIIIIGETLPQHNYRHRWEINLYGNAIITFNDNLLNIFFHLLNQLLAFANKKWL
ncbi:MAG: hypothetical protein KDE33_20915 [Bacteroidetes bacterium]|nr:hypothetical protein [Bacteroidota bacterium]